MHTFAAATDYGVEAGYTDTMRFVSLLDPVCNLESLLTYGLVTPEWLPAGLQQEQANKQKNQLLQIWSNLVNELNICQFSTVLA